MGGGVHGGRWRVVFLSAVLFCVGARAGEEASVAEDAPGVVSEDGKPAVKLFGRVLARMESDQRAEYARDLSIPQARLGVEAAIPNALAVVSADVASKSLLKDAFVRVHDVEQRYRLYAGQFKAPFLARELESTWELPRIGRGLVDDYLVETQELGGRRLGAMAEVKPGWHGLKISAGMFRGSLDELGARTSEDASARVQLNPLKKVLTLGVSTYLAEVFDGTRRFGAAADATARLGGFRLTGEGVLGRLPVGDYQAGIMLLRYDLVLGGGEWLIQPEVNAELLQLQTPARSRGWSLGGGVNVAYLDRVKVQLQWERAFQPGDVVPGNALAVQVGARF